MDMILFNHVDNLYESAFMNVQKEHHGVSTLVGTPKEVRVRLNQSRAEQVLVVTFEHQNHHGTKALIENLSNMASSMFGVFQQQHQSRVTLERLAEALVPPVPTSPHIIKEVAMLVKARKGVLESGDWLTAAEITELAQLSTANPSAQPNKWKKAGRIFAIHHNGVDYFPAYGLNKDEGFRPLKSMAHVIEVFNDYKDGWGMAFWFLSANSFLGGERPQDMLATQPERVIEAARDEIHGVEHD
ncbi:hypothetical protein LU631_20275 [Erwinia tracheiphila]|nr:hypothetical protein [Erwinia tracheiphila]UIA84529.1 hypothetical protein LU604_06030 [Erwinia tracheiphila]UIA87095.1 hypothetical protein LU631_20275 [Erwinia tracheiphila]UIA93122.1 hypothetical protein LU632_06015 [Erwinia tracheiphila]UIA95455.1 hypothetical protein LU633_18730 [Erwinia tracheiphila]